MIEVEGWIISWPFEKKKGQNADLLMTNISRYNELRIFIAIFLKCKRETKMLERQLS